MVLETNVIEKMHRRIVKSFLDVLVLAELRKNAMSGYDIIGFIHSKFRMLVSSGTVYSLLYAMERKGLIRGRWDQKKRIYMLNANNEIQSLVKSLLSY